MSEVIAEEFVIALDPPGALQWGLAKAIDKIEAEAVTKWGGGPQTHKTRVIEVQEQGRYERAPWLTSHVRLIVIREYERFELMIDHDTISGYPPDLGAGPRSLVKVAARER